jgi:hypothetical protein
VNRNDEFRAMQRTLMAMASELARQHGFDPTEIKIEISMRLPPEAEMIKVTVTQEALS